MAASNRSSRRKTSNSSAGRRKRRSKPRPWPPVSDHPLEKVCFKRDPIPEGYVFVPKGDVYITRHCKVKTKESQQTVYAVYDKSSKWSLGIRVPSDIYAMVSQSATETADSRANAVKLRDERDQAHSRQLLRTQFPNMPEDSLGTILDHAFLKGSGRVGRTGMKTDAKKASLAVEAYIRHKLTPYDALLNDGHGRTEARKAVWDTVRAIKATWERKPLEPVDVVDLRSPTPPDTDMQSSDEDCLIS